MCRRFWLLVVSVVWLGSVACEETDVPVQTADGATEVAESADVVGGEADVSAPSGEVRLSLWAAPAGNPFAGVESLGIVVERRDEERAESTVPFAGADALQTVAVPLGVDVRLVVETRGDVTLAGATGWLRAEAGVPPVERSVFLMEPETFAPTTDRDGVETGLGRPRFGATATVLEDGRVLVVGGATRVGDAIRPASADPTGTAELFDPQTGTFSTLSSGLATPRVFHRAVRLPDPDGPDRVAIFGGLAPDGDALAPVASVEVFDPATETFTSDGVPPMAAARAHHTATVVDDRGRVLLVGGQGAGAGSWELWDVAEGTVKDGDPNAPRWNHTATFVPAGFGANDVVFLFGGEDDTGVHNEGELYLADNETLGEGFVPALRPRTGHRTVWVEGQRLIYVFGGYEDRGYARPVAAVDVFQPGCSIPEGGTIGDCWRASAGFELSRPRGFHTATPLPRNAILIHGGCGALDVAGTCGVAESEVVFQTDTVRDTPEGREIVHEVKLGDLDARTRWPRALHAAVALQSGRVLLVGGLRDDADGRVLVPQAELFEPLR